jgi:hypothetical protein
MEWSPRQRCCSHRYFHRLAGITAHIVIAHVGVGVAVFGIFILWTIAIFKVIIVVTMNLGKSNQQ